MAALAARVDLALEAFEHVVDALDALCVHRVGGGVRAHAAAADQQQRPRGQNVRPQAFEEAREGAAFGPVN